MEVSVISGASNTESVLVIIWTSLAVLLNAAFSASGEKMPIIMPELGLVLLLKNLI